MSISFSGAGSGLPVSDWITQLMSIERQPVDKLYTQKSNLSVAQNALSSVKSKFSALSSAIGKLTDSRLSSSFDIFSNKSATSSDTDIVSATASNSSVVQNLKLKIESIATPTTAKSNSDISRLAALSDNITSLGNAQGSAGQFSIYVDGKKNVFQVTDTSTVQSVIDDINNKGLGLTASLQDGKFSISMADAVAANFKLGASDDTSNFLNIAKLSTVTGQSDGTTTKFTSSSALNAIDTSGTMLAGTSGDFTINVNGTDHKFTVDASSTIDSVSQSINDANLGVTASVTDGKFSLSYGSSVTSFRMGPADTNTSDSSNFLKVMGISGTSGVTDSATGITKYTGSRSVSASDQSKLFVGNFASANLSSSVTKGTFIIGKATFNIDEKTSLDGLINEINSNKDAGVIAQFDFVENKLKLSSKNPGSTAINLVDGTSGFLKAVGLVDGTGDSIKSQTFGNNAKFYINGSTTPIIANSNTVTGDISGLSGVTLNLNDVTETDKTVSVNITQDNSAVQSAVSDFISKFNDVINIIDADTYVKKSSSSGTDSVSHGTLYGETALVSLRNKLRSTVTNAVSGLNTSTTSTNYSYLGAIGITTGDVAKSASADTTNLQLDASKLSKALADNPADVKALLVGDSSRNITGIMQNLSDIIKGSLDYSNGYFASRADSMSRSIKDLNDSITRGEDRLATRKEQLTKQFAAMDSAIASMQQQSSAISAI